MMKRILEILLLLLIALRCDAGPDNPGPGPNAITVLWSTPTTVTTAGLTSTASYPIGRDGELAVDLTIGNCAATKQVTLTAVFELPGGNTAGYPEEALPTEQYVWVQGTDPTPAMWEVVPPKHAAKMYLRVDTNDTDGVSITARVNGR